MGEAKRRAMDRAENEKLVKPLSEARFHLLSIGVRMAVSRLTSGEISYWSDHEERILGLISLDFTDRDFAWMILARDRIGRFRCCMVDASIESEPLATEILLREMAKLVKEGIPADFGWQGDEPNAPFDVLSVTHGEKLHQYFEVLNDAGHMPARAALKEIGPWLAPADPHFVKEFQTTAFDQRIWELYLWAAFRELGFDVTQPEAPDFSCRAPGIAFTVEATAVSPSTAGPLAVHPEPTTPEEQAEFLKNYMPMKFGSSLTSKLNKKNAAGEPYWDRAETRGKPFIIAIADFHKSADFEKLGSMTYSHSALWPYLYGKRVVFEPKEEGGGYWRMVNGEEHIYGGKTIPTGFFDLPGAENVSAVVFSNAGTLPKFNRMGLRAGFVPENHLYFRQGYRYDPSPEAYVGIPFHEDILSPDYEEYWSDELQVFHNPNARNPISPETFGGITQYYFKDGELYSITPESAVIASFTAVMRIVGDEEWATLG
ncbi:hypothetical protein [Rhizobium sp. 2TAF27]|uniref:hypothetical protein n=1 Tax=Rhizobium sp. 2TAF27 TaxID=3233013 RepID=UPI003F971585